jgi:hypothetical protein
MRTTRLGFAAAASALLLVGSVAFTATRTPRSTIRMGPSDLRSGPAPFRGTTEPSIEAAESLLGVHIPRPHAVTANDRRAWSVVVDERNRRVAITYAHTPTFWYSRHARVQVTVEFRGRFYATSAGFWNWARREVRSMGAVASLITVNRWPAIFMQGNYTGDCGHPHPGEDGCAPAQHNPCVILMQVGRSIVTMYGPPEWDLAGMADLAATVR